MSPELKTEVSIESFLMKIHGILNMFPGAFKATEQLKKTSDPSKKNLKQFAMLEKDQFLKIPFDLTIAIEFDLIPESEMLSAQIDILKSCQNGKTIDTALLVDNRTDMWDQFKKISDCFQSVYDKIIILQTELDNFISTVSAA